MFSSRRRAPTAVAIRLSRRGLFMFLVGIAAVLLAYGIGRRELLYVGLLLVLIPLLAAGLVRFHRSRMSVSRGFSPPVVAAGQPTVVTIEVSNLSGSWSGEARWQDAVSWTHFRSASGSLPSLRPRRAGRPSAGTTTWLRYELIPPRRGVFEIGPLFVGFTDPFGLATGVAPVGGRQPLVVVPAAAALPRGERLVAADDGSSRTRHRQAIGGVDDLMAREYRMGDALRRIHWRASAHKGDLMVRQEEQRSHAEAQLFFDTRLTGYHDASSEGHDGAPESDSFEWAVRLVASLGLHLHGAGFAVRIRESAYRQIAPLDRTDEFLESLAVLQLVDSDASSRAFLSTDVEHSTGSVFAVLSDADADVLDVLLKGRPAFETAVAFLVASRDEAMAGRLSRAGWLCIHVRPGGSIESAWLAAMAALDGVRGHA